MNTLDNRRILLVDDMAEIHRDFRKILARETATASAHPEGILIPTEADLEADEAILFGAQKPARPNRGSPKGFDMDSAFQGHEALEKVRSALDGNRPYALAFVDMRMPPGWDGVETVEHLWDADPRLQVVFCTAYSDHSWKEVLERLDVRDRLLILKKPFDPIEVYQFAHALTTKWTRAEQAAFKMSALEDAVETRTRELSNANIIVQNSPVILYRLRGEPAFPLIYVSHNITKLGHDPARLTASPDWATHLIHPDDRAKVGEAMTRLLEKTSDGSSIEFHLIAGDGTLRWVDNRYIPVRDSDGRLVEVEGIVIDITERKAAEEKIAQLARTDTLTGLANRATFRERLLQCFAAAHRGALPFAILSLDLDKFKPVNDTHGHPTGDLLLQEVAKRLRACTRETDLVARLGGDEFAVLQTELTEPAANAGELADRIQHELGLPYHLKAAELNISVSIGICPYVPGIPDSDAMLAQADRALYRSKEEGRNQYHFHSQTLDQEVVNRVTLGGELLRAIADQELELEYQPQVEITTGKIVGIEALVRWNHPTRGLLPPAVFIPIAEKTGAILPLGHWVLDEACRQVKAWRSQGLNVPAIAVNLSFHQLKAGSSLIRDVTGTLEKWGLSPSDLEFDVTEATLAQLKWNQNDVLPQLRALGIKIAIDGFGSDYSSFDYIKEYRVNHLKIARSYIHEATTNAEHATAVRAIMRFAHDIGIAVIAQGVETEEQSALLKEADATTQGQGFHFSRAVSAENAAELLRRGSINLGEIARKLCTDASR
jgi:diguanylate cyclase (GGDEF)-like protein/PAS domain S-box-containing protein